MTLQKQPPRPRLARVAPSYPRALAAIATALVASACAIYPDLNGEQPNPSGDIAYPYDSGADETASDGGADATDTDVQPDGTGSFPYDTGADPPDATPDADPDAAPDAPADATPSETSPDPAGDIAYPYDDGGADSGPGSDDAGFGG